jgi:periplasmic divalent cation tolerance protein
MSDASSEPIAVFITAPNREEASRLAEILVSERLAACVQILPDIESVYRWKEKTERQQEVLIIVKTTDEKFEALERAVREIHSYETPEIVALPIIAGTKTYLEWLTASVSPPS